MCRVESIRVDSIGRVDNFGTLGEIRVIYTYLWGFVLWSNMEPLTLLVEISGLCGVYASRSMERFKRFLELTWVNDFWS